MTLTLDTFNKEFLVTMILQQQEALIEMNGMFELLLEQIRISVNAGMFLTQKAGHN